MADVKVPALLHKMSKAAQKAWYKKNNMTMPSEVEGGGRSAAAAKRVVAPAPRKQMAAAPQSVRAMNTARQQAYYAKGGRQPIGAGGSGGSSSMAGVGQSSAKEIIKGIKAGYNPKVALVRYTNEEAEQVDEVTKKEAEETLGGPVKTKPKMPPGKQPEGYRYVRALARRAMKAGLKKEEAEQVDEVDYKKYLKVSQEKRPLTMKSVDSALAADKEGNPNPLRKLQNTNAARKFAQKQLTKKFNASQPAKPFPVYGPGRRYVGDSVELDGPTIDEARRMSAAEKLGRAFDSEQQRSALSRQRGNELLKSREKENDAVKAQTKKLKGMHEEVKDMSYGKKLAKAIMAKQSKHPIAQQMGEAVKDQADVGEYDYEGDMAKSQLRSILANAQRLHDMLEDQTNLPEWVQSKITLAEDYILTAANYMEGEMNEEVEQVDEKIDLEKAKMGDVIKDFQKSDAPQFKGKSMEKRREMAIAAKLGAERGMKEELEQVDEADVKSKPVLHKGKSIGETGIDTEASPGGGEWYAKHHKSGMNTVGFDSRKKAEAEVRAAHGIKEEAEQVDEAGYQVIGTTKDKETFRSKVHPKKADALSTHYKMAKSRKYKDIKLVKVQEEVEQIDELKKSTLASYIGKAAGRLAAASRLERDFEKDGHTAIAGEFKRSARNKRSGIEKAANKLANEAAEGKVAVTPKEKSLAAHHGDKTKITFGDVIKARLKSAAAKKMGK